jgi:hypothetical protein
VRAGEALRQRRPPPLDGEDLAIEMDAGDSICVTDVICVVDSICVIDGISVINGISVNDSWVDPTVGAEVATPAAAAPERSPDKSTAGTGGAGAARKEDDAGVRRYFKQFLMSFRPQHTS